MDSRPTAPTFDPNRQKLDRTSKDGYRRASSFAIAGLGLCPVALFWGFSVDDAWIVTRIVEVAKYTGTFSLNPGEPAVDAVTPLGFAQLLCLLSSALHWPVFEVARGLGVLSWAGAYFVAARSFRSLGVREGALLGLMAFVSVTGGAWAGAGLETPVVALILTTGLSLLERSPLLAASLAGLGAALRPDLIPIVLVASQLHHRSPPVRLRIFVFALLPVLLIMGVRGAVFGEVLPLAFRAKPPDLATGLRYALGSLAFSGPFWLLIAGRGAEGRRLGAVALVHWVSLVLAGGDWMPLYRLSCPLLPWVSVLGVRAARGRVVTCAAILLSLGGPLLLTLSYRPDAVEVIRTRRALIESARPLLEGAHRVSSVDIGWLSQAAPGDVVDLSGVANPRVARLPGGHTSHRIPAAFLDHERVDAWVVRVWDSPESTNGLVAEEPSLPSPGRAVYAVDRELLRGAAELGFVSKGEISIDRTGSSYAILRRDPELLGAF